MERCKRLWKYLINTIDEPECPRKPCAACPIGDALEGALERDQLQAQLAQVTARKNDLVQDWMAAVGRAISERDAAEALVERYRELLRKVEWHDRDEDGLEGWYRCPICGGHKEDGHYPDCELAKALEGK